MYPQSVILGDAAHAGMGFTHAPGAVSDSAAINFAIKQAAYVEREVNMAPRPQVQYPMLVDVDTSAPDFTKTITYYSGDQYGRAKWLNGNSDDVPVAGSELTPHEQSVYTFGIGYRWGWEELGCAMLSNYQLQSNDAMAARRGAEEFVDRLVLQGDTRKGTYGLFNNPVVTVNTATYGGWLVPGGPIVEDQILEDVNLALLAVGQATNFVVAASHLGLSHLHYRVLATRRLGDTDTTLLEFLRMNNTYTAMTGQPLTIVAIRGLETAGAGGVARMVAWRKDPTVVKLHMPMPHRFLPVHRDGPLNWVVPGVARVAPLEFKRTEEIQYVDGI